MHNREAELRKILEGDCGAAEFVELALLLSADPKSRPEAREFCFRGLTEHPESVRGRLALARLFYLDGYSEFAVRELIELSRLVQTPSLKKLLDSFGPLAQRFYQSSPKPEEEAPIDETPGAEDGGVVAEIDIEADFLGALDELVDQKEDK